VVGYSRLAAADEDRTLSRLRGLRSDLIDPAIAAHHGRVVKRTGDGLKDCGDDLSRENIMRQAANLKDSELLMPLPGIRLSTSPDNCRVVRQLPLATFDGEKWEVSGELISDRVARDSRASMTNSRSTAPSAPPTKTGMAKLITSGPPQPYTCASATPSPAARLSYPAISGISFYSLDEMPALHEAGVFGSIYR
jgi:hypothetical protein